VQKGKVVKVTVRLPQDVHAEAVEVAREQRRSLNTAIVVAVEQYVRRMKARQPKDAGDR
jgi:predicted HicB family RNase H-like nuclease